MQMNYTFFLSWLLLGPLMFFTGRIFSCYYPFLLSRKYYITIKNARLQNLLISDQKNRSKSTKTQVEDRNKMSIVGIIYYSLQTVLLTLFYTFAICILIADIKDIILADSVISEHICAVSSSGSLIVFLIGFMLSWLDYDLGKLLNM